MVLGSDEDRYFQVGAQLPPAEREELVSFLKENIDVFAWNAYEAPGNDLDFICHHLNVNPTTVPKKQPPQCSLRDHAETVQEKVNKLM